MIASRKRATRIGIFLLGILVALIAIASVSGNAAISPVVAFGLVAAYMILAAATILRLDLNQIRESVQSRSQSLAATSRVTNAARRASGRAKAHSEYGMGTDILLLDIGMLINARRDDGKWNRRIAESVALDDEFIQPFIKIHVPLELAERHTTLEFEYYDRAGRLQFSHSMEDYLRAGENLILCERQLGLKNASEQMRVGTWDLRVKVDGVMLGMHDFSMSSARDTGSAEERAERQQVVSASRLSYEDAEDEGAPVSLEDLLREQARRSSGQA